MPFVRREEIVLRELPDVVMHVKVVFRPAQTAGSTAISHKHVSLLCEWILEERTEAAYTDLKGLCVVVEEAYCENIR